MPCAPMFHGLYWVICYCPSIEDKIVRFSDKPRHQALEPEGKYGGSVYSRRANQDDS